MTRLLKISTLFALLLTFMAITAPESHAQDHEQMEAGEVLISIYRIAPGQHVNFLNWMAAREEVSKELGLPVGHFFAHQDGASWDYIAINRVTSDEEDAMVEQLAAEKGLTTGFGASLEIRQFVSSHTDTFAFGPTTATELASMAQGGK